MTNRCAEISTHFYPTATIATAIATRMTITLRRDLGGRMAAVNRSLLPVMESCSPGFAGSRWI